MNENKNLILTIVLSMLVLLGWNYFYAAPLAEKQKIAAKITQQQQAPAGTVPQLGGSTPSVNAPLVAPSAVVKSQAEALASTKRVKIETDRITGSLSLQNGRIDDISFKQYHETIDKKSSLIHYLSPEMTKDPLFVEQVYITGDLATAAYFGKDKEWQVVSGSVLTTKTPVVISYEDKGVKVTRTLTVDDNFLITTKDKVENISDKDVIIRAYSQILRQGTPKTEGFYILHEGLIGMMGEKGLQEVTYDKIDKEKVNSFKGKGGWLGMTDKYWAVALIPNANASVESKFLSQAIGTVKIYHAEFAGEATVLKANTSAEFSQSLFVGAKEVKTIEAYSKANPDLRFDLLIDWGLFHFITKPLFWLIDWFYSLVNNFGVAIILTTLVIKGLFFPLAQKSYASIVKMKKVQPEMEALKLKHKDDRMKMQQDLMALYKKEQINPMAGCWPVLLQIPVFFALYKVLFVTIEMRHAPFFGWIKDLSAPDPTSMFNLFGLLPFDPSQVPLIGTYLVLGIWPIVMGITMWVQMQMNPAPNDPTQAIIFRWMPVMFTFMLASFPAGLVIYWSWSNLLSILQQWLIMRKFGVKVELWNNLKAMFGK